MNRRSFLRSLFAAPVAAITATRLVQAEEPVAEPLGRFYTDWPRVFHDSMTWTYDNRPALTWTAVETPKPLVWHEGTLAEFNEILNRKENEFWRDQILADLDLELVGQLVQHLCPQITEFRAHPAQRHRPLPLRPPTRYLGPHLPRANAGWQPVIVDLDVTRGRARGA